MAPISTKKSNLEDGHKLQGRCVKIVIRSQQIRPPVQGLMRRWRSWQFAANGTLQFRQPGREPFPISLKQGLEPNDIISPGPSFDKPLNCAVLNEAVRLGKRWQDTDGAMAIPTEKAPDPQRKISRLQSAQVATVIAVRPQRTRLVAMGTSLRRRDSTMKILFDISFCMDWNGADLLHPHNLLNNRRSSVNTVRCQRLGPAGVVR
jgi:hypothetical protein